MRLIDVDALMVVLEKIPAVGFKNIDNQTYTLVLLAQVLNIIKQQLTIERKTGKWIRGDAEKLTGSQRCSICHKACYKGRDYFNYCPNCGARMEVEHD